MEGSSDSMQVNLPPTQTMAQYEWKGIINKAGLSFSQATGFRALGVAMENEEGVVVDNFSMRGNSGLVLERLDSIQCRALNDIRPYDLIILQYGLNVAILEKNGFLGGNTMRASSGMNASESIVQARLGVNDSMQKFYDETLKGGGYMNDREMLSMAGVGVAMGNANAEVQKHADLVTQDHNSDGIYHALNKLGLITA